MELDHETDELVASLPIHFSNALVPNVHLHQYPLLNRPLQVPPSAQLVGKRISARIKPEVGRMELHIPADTRSEVWNKDKARDLGAAQIDDDIEKKQEKKIYKDEEPCLGEIRLQNEQIPQRGAQMLGIIRNGKLNLHRISEAHQFRPTLTYLDILSRCDRRSRPGGSDSESDGPPPDPDEPPPIEMLKKDRNTSGSGKEVQVSARKGDDKGGASTLGGLSAVRRDMLRAVRMEEDEEWSELQFLDTTTNESAEALETIFSQSADVLVTKDDITLFLQDIRGL